jgi:putative peptidoglycan lipid II flippase
MIANMFLNVLFVVPMVIYDIEGPHTGLALATSASAYMNAGMLYLGLRRQGIYSPLAGWIRTTLQIVFSSACMAVFLILLSPGLGHWNSWTLMERIPYLLGFVSIAILIYLLAMLITGFRPAHLHHGD